MTKRQVLTAALLGFVVVSFGSLALRNRQAAQEWITPPGARATQVGAARAPGLSIAPGKTIVYYFHVSVRCTTCRAIEAYAKEVVQERFANEVAAGAVEWRLVNLQLAQNQHYIQDYQLFTKSLVLVRVNQAGREEFEVLNDTWELVGEKALMQQYVERKIRDFVRKQG